MQEREVEVGKTYIWQGHRLKVLSKHSYYVFGRLHDGPDGELYVAYTELRAESK